MHQAQSVSAVNLTAIRMVLLPGGRRLLVDKDVVPWLRVSKIKLASFPHTTSVQAICNGQRLSRLIMQAPADKEVDHINGDTLDNRRENLRLCSRSENACNRKGWAKSGFKGVCFHTKLRKFIAYICKDKKQKHLGYFDEPEDAARAYNDAAILLHGAFAKLNVVAGPSRS